MAAWYINDWIHMAPFPRSAYSPLLFTTLSWVCCFIAINRYLFAAAAIAVVFFAWSLLAEPNPILLTTFLLLWIAAARDVYIWKNKNA